jgi:hypothetical protein
MSTCAISFLKALLEIYREWRIKDTLVMSNRQGLSQFPQMFIPYM